MLSALHRFIVGRSAAQVAALSIAGVCVVGVFDLLTGYELSFSVFYTLPIGLAAWYAGRRPGWAMCLLAAATWFAMDRLAGHPYSHPAIPVWNAAVRLAFFWLIATLLAHLREVLQAQIRLARRDGLTGLLNARAFREACDECLALSGRHARPVALGCLDLDGFKDVNDRLGHATGDEVLRAVAQTLQQRLRRHDLCARLGGDEFAVLLPETDLAGARSVFGTLCRHLEERMALAGWPVGFSVGVAVFDPPSVGVEEAMRHADALMYEVKRGGKNGLRVEAVAVEAAQA